MQITQQIISYLFPVLLALAILYFFFGVVYMKYIHDYAKIKEGEEKSFFALAVLFWVLVIWAVVYSVVAAVA